MGSSLLIKKGQTIDLGIHLYKNEVKEVFFNKDDRML
jgi:hypothetical protein